MNNAPSKDHLSKETINYYDQHAGSYAADTHHLDLNYLYQPFIELLPPGAAILDVGCGSGRDSAFFKQAGYQVTALDGSIRMVNEAAVHLGKSVFHLRFDQINFENTFDGIWANASLLHVPRKQMPDILNRLSKALIHSGILYMSFKYGSEEQFRNGRIFTDYEETLFHTMVAACPDLVIKKLWKTRDARPQRDNEFWLNTLCQKY
jgi:SAM-dependent methyltransferase